mmetsp:Transcript_28160/g.24890  ORF Transcript_28160/g.24890 Transcript_28160/m.24890 type:complete len:151 (+) Transcript_28160:15-467(+)
MKFLLVISIILLSASAYDSFWQKGDSLLTELQNGKDEIFIISFYNPSPIKDDYTRQNFNNKIMDELQSSILNKYHGEPLSIRYSSIDSTDRDNDTLLYKAGIHSNKLEKGPVILITRKGNGHTVWGPTIIQKVEDFVKKLQESARDSLNQ